MDVHILHLVDRAEERAGSGDPAAVVTDAVKRCLQRFAGGDRTHQHQDVLVADRHLHVVAEYDLSRRAVLRAQDIE